MYLSKTIKHNRAGQNTMKMKSKLQLVSVKTVGLFDTEWVRFTALHTSLHNEPLHCACCAMGLYPEAKASRRNNNCLYAEYELLGLWTVCQLNWEQSIYNWTVRSKLMSLLSCCKLSSSITWAVLSNLKPTFWKKRLELFGTGMFIWR